MSMRYKLPPGGDCPPAAAARRIWLSLEEFKAQLPTLLARGFPQADPTTGNYDIDAIDAWRRSRYPHLFREQLTPVSTARNARDVVRARLTRVGGDG
jgi:hypothetical protein